MILMGEVYLEYPKMLSVKTASQTAIQINGASDFVGGPREAGWVGGNIETIGGIMYG